MSGIPVSFPPCKGRSGRYIIGFNQRKVVRRVNKLLCRGVQAVIKAGHCFMGYRMPECIEGPGSIRRLPAMLREKGAGHVLLVTGRTTVKRGLLDEMLAIMEELDVRYTLFDQVSPDPTSDDVEAGFRLYRDKGCQAIVAVGGGSPMDCAKAIGARAAQPNKTVAQLQGVLKVHRRVPPFFAVPTTAGSGSETTVAAVITDAATHHKASINDPAILPRYAVLDPELTLGMPPFLTATTGMDALCHAVEAYTNRTYNTKLEDELARGAVKLIHGNLPAAFRNGSDLEARQNMQRAAFFAGRAFTRGCVGYVHAVGHALGGLYGVPHGLAMGVLLPYVMKQYGPAVYGRLADLADVCGMTGGSKKEKALRFIAWMEQLKADLGLPVGLDMIREEDVPQITAWALKEANPLYPVPVIWGERDVRRLLDDLRA